MPLVPGFSVGNNSVITSQFLVTDLSTGSDPAIANRLLYIYDSANNLLSGTPIQFPLSAGSTITPSILQYDLAYSAIMNWVDSGGVVLYTLSQIGVFTGFLEWFYYGLTQEIAASPNLINDNVFFPNYSKLRTLIDSANQSISIVGSIFNAQNMVLMAQKLSKNPKTYF